VADVWAAATAGALVVVAAGVGLVLNLAGYSVRASSSAPVFGSWLPHAGLGTPAALAVAAAAAWWGPGLAARLPWRPLLAGAYAVAVAWILSLAMVDGWQVGLAGRLATQPEYLTDVTRAADTVGLLRGFTARILDFQPDSWTTHVAGHPPGALLVFVWLHRAGLGGGAWAALCCVAVGAVTAVAVPVTVRAIAGEAAARVAVPFAVLFPGAVWIGASADGVFAGVTSAGIALLATGLVRGGVAGHAAILVAGALLAFGSYLSYGLVLMAPIVVGTVAGAARRTGRPWQATVRRLTPALAGGISVVVVFTAAGFWWLDGYRLVVERYHQGIASDRAYAYWVWANLACLALAAGPVAAPVLRRAAVAARARLMATVRRWPPAWSLLPLAAAVAIVVADLSGLSKAEVERIWLPFAVWLPAGAVALPASTRRGWLAAQAATALAVNHLILTNW
jgi:hypothetical protein